MYLILLCFGTLFGLGAFFLLAGLLRLPTSASTKAVLTVTNRGKAKKNSMNAILFDMAAKAVPLVQLDAYKRRKLEVKMLLIRVTKRKALLLLFFYQKTEVKGP